MRRITAAAAATALTIGITVAAPGVASADLVRPERDPDLNVQLYENFYTKIKGSDGTFTRPERDTDRLAQLYANFETKGKTRPRAGLLRALQARSR